MATKKAMKKSATKKSSTKKAAKKVPAKKSPAKKSPAKKSPPKKSSAKKSSAKKTASKKSSAKKSGRKYGPAVGKQVQTEMHEMHQGTLKSGRSGKKVTNPKQAIAIALSEAREKGARVPENPNK